MKLNKHIVSLIIGLWIFNLGILGLFIQMNSYQEEAIIAKQELKEVESPAYAFSNH